MTAELRNFSPKLQGLLVLFSWLGLFTHNYIESVDGSTLAVAAISVGLFLAWWKISSRRALATRLLLALGLTELIGAIVTVIPSGFLPFSPEQTLRHYLAHLAYGVLQLPLITVTIRKTRST